MSSSIPLLNPYDDLFRVLSQRDPEFQLQIRKKIIWAYSWAIPNQNAIEGIIKFSPIVELGAGSGYWAWLLMQAGAEVIALDVEPLQPPLWLIPKRGNAEQVSHYPDHALLLCWPPYESPMAYQALRAYKGRTIIYIGE